MSSEQSHLLLEWRPPYPISNPPSGNLNVLGASSPMHTLDFEAAYQEVFRSHRETLESIGHLPPSFVTMQVRRRHRPTNQVYSQLYLGLEQGQAGHTFFAEALERLVQRPLFDFVAFSVEVRVLPAPHKGAGKAARHKNFIDSEEDGSPVIQLRQPADWEDAYPEGRSMLLFNILSKDSQAISLCPVERKPGCARAFMPYQAHLAYVSDASMVPDGIFIRERIVQ